MKRILLTLLLLGFAANTLQAAEPRRKNRKRKAATETAAIPEPAPEILPEEPAAEETADSLPVASPRLTPYAALTPEEVDSLTAVWRQEQNQEAFNRFFDAYIVEDTTAWERDRTPDSVYIGRLRALASPVPLPYNHVVKGSIVRYTNNSYGLMNRILGLSQYYFPLIEEELIKADLPIELRALPIIESALQATATSRAGAVGLWQFMPSTGKVYGLEINSLVDERRDPMLATQAACRYLKDLYNIYKDWSLAIAAYNCGPGNVNKALARSGRSGGSFWDIYDYLPRETRGYVPAFIGATYAYAYHRSHGIVSDEPPLPLAVDTVRVDRLMHFEQIASTIDLPMETLRLLNPQYKLDIIPATTKSYTLVLPQQYVSQYIANEEAIFAKDSTYLKEYIDPANLDKKRQERTGTVHVVKKGETLGAIARKYHVTVKQIMRWNNIKNADKLRLGQRLRIEGR